MGIGSAVWAPRGKEIDFFGQGVYVQFYKFLRLGKTGYAAQEWVGLGWVDGICVRLGVEGFPAKNDLTLEVAEISVKYAGCFKHPESDGIYFENVWNLQSLRWAINTPHICSAGNNNKKQLCN